MIEGTKIHFTTEIVVLNFPFSGSFRINHYSTEVKDLNKFNDEKNIIFLFHTTNFVGMQ